MARAQTNTKLDTVNADEFDFNYASDQSDPFVSIVIEDDVIGFLGADTREPKPGYGAYDPDASVESFGIVIEDDIVGF